MKKKVKIMHNTGQISNHISYEGKVTFKLIRNNKEYDLFTKNAGTKFLRDLVCRALLGSDITDDLPRYMNFTYTYKDDSNILRTSNLLLQRVLIDTKTTGEAAGTTEVESVLLLKALISFSDLLSEINLRELDGIRSVQLTLESRGVNGRGQILASIEDIHDGEKWVTDNLVNLYESINGKLNDPGVTGTDAMIEWRMIFRNGGTR
jgi:hypothetical protein